MKLQVFFGEVYQINMKFNFRKGTWICGCILIVVMSTTHLLNLVQNFSYLYNYIYKFSRLQYSILSLVTSAWTIINCQVFSFAMVKQPKKVLYQFWKIIFNYKAYALGSFSFIAPFWIRKRNIKRSCKQKTNLNRVCKSRLCQ